MATLNRVCLSLASSSSVIYSTLCARHRFLLSNLSRHGYACLSSLNHKEKDKSLKTSADSASVVSAKEMLETATSDEWNRDINIDTSDVGIGVNGTEFSGDEDLIKLRSTSKKNKDLLFEKLPPRARSALNFTIGRQITTLEKARTAQAKRRSLVDEPLIELGVPEKVPASGLQLKRSRTNPTSASTLEMMEYLETHHKLFLKDEVLYSHSLPSLLGATVEEVTSTAQELREVGFSPDDVDRLLPVFPHIVEVNFENVLDVFRLLREHLHHKNRVFGLIHTHPFLLTLDPAQVQETLETLTSLGLDSVELFSLFTHQPLLFFTPLSERTLERIKQSQEAGLGSRWLSKALLYNMRFRPSRAEFGPNATMVTKLLSSYGVDVGDVLIKYPDLFSHSCEQLLVLIKTLSGGPMYLNKEDIARLFSQIPEVLCQLENMEALRAHLSLLSEIFTASILRTQLHSVKLLIDYRSDPVAKLRVLAEAGFDKEAVSTMIINSPSVLLQQDLREKIQLLLDIPSTIHGQIVESARVCLQHPLPSLQARIKFAREHLREVLHGDQLEGLLATSDEKFASLCGHKTESYYSHTGFTPLTQYEKAKRKRGRPKKNTKSEGAAKQDKLLKAEAPYYVFRGEVSLDSIFSRTSLEEPNPLPTAVSNPPHLGIQPPPSPIFDDIVTEDISPFKSPEELSSVQLTLESLSFDSMEDSKGDSSEAFESTDSIVNKEMEELLHELRGASFTKDPLFDGSPLSVVSRGGEFTEDFLFWEYGGFEDELYEQQTAQQNR